MQLSFLHCFDNAGWMTCKTYYVRLMAFFHDNLGKLAPEKQNHSGKANLDLLEQWHQLGDMQICTLLQTNNNASTPPLSSLHARCPSCHPTTASKHLRQKCKTSWP